MRHEKKKAQSAMTHRWVLASLKRLERAGPGLILLVILILAAVLRVWGMDYGLPHLTARPDEERIVGRAIHILATGDFHPGDLVYLGLLKYLNTLALALYVGLGKLQGNYEKVADFLFEAAVLQPGIQFRICRTVSVAAGVATVAATYLLGRDAYQERMVGFIASGVAATSMIHVRDSRFATVDATMTLFVTLSLLFAVRVTHRYRNVDFVLAGLFAGLATATKYNAGLVILGVCFACLPALTGRSRPGGTPPRMTVLARLVGSGAVMALAFAVSTPYTIVYLSEVFDKFGEIRAMLYDGDGSPAIWVHLQTTFPEGCGWPFFLAAVGGVVRAVWQRRPADIVLLAFFIPSFATAAGVRWIFPRYVIPYIPLLAVLAAELTFFLCRSRKALAVAAGFLLAGPGLSKSTEFDRVAARKDTRVLASEWVAEHITPQTEILLCRGYGAPSINSDRRRPPAFLPREIDCAPDMVAASDARFVITHDHPSLHLYSGITERMQDYLESNGRLRVVFDPFKEGRKEEPFFYVGDAFYLPISHLDAMERGGPILTIWELGPS